ncbi:hypothetical protein MED193_00935 [Roseobacter sp. MED193]|nr:hypothetical protein MED193_00935 [Roseobacter sp. MED193]
MAAHLRGHFLGNICSPMAKVFMGAILEGTRSKSAVNTRLANLRSN